MTEILDLSRKDRWQEVLAQLPIDKRDIYYTPEYYELYERNGDGKSLCFVFQNEIGLAIYPFLLNPIPEYLGMSERYFDIQGAYGYNGVVYSTMHDGFRSLFYTAFERYCKSANIIAEFSRFHPIIGNARFSQDHMSVLPDRKTVALDLSPSIEHIWTDSYSSNNRNMIRKAKKNNIVVVESNSESDYRDFYDIYTETMQQVHADDYYFFNKTYFDNFADLLAQQHRLLVAKMDGTVIAGMLLMYMGRYAHYHLSGRSKTYAKYAANNLLLDEAIRLSKKMGCDCFHLGGGTTSSEEDFLFKFKSNFSKEKFDFQIGKKVHNEQVYNDVINRWEQLNPDKKSLTLLLKYRY